MTATLSFRKIAWFGQLRTQRPQAMQPTLQVGCIACGLCVRNCPNQAIFLKDNVAVIDYTKCNGCGTCVSKCPKKAIQWVEGTPRPIDAPVPAHEVLKTRV